MKKTLLIAGALLALSASMASAQGGMNLSWTDCGAAGQAARTFACASNSGANVLIISAISPVPMDHLNSAAFVIDLQTNVAVLSDWWNFSPGGCRATGAFSGNGIFSSGPFTCIDAWGGAGAGGVNYTYGFGGVNRARIRGVFAIAGSTTSDGVSEYYLAQCIINNTKTTGLGKCNGCADGVCLVLNSIQLTQPAGVGPNFTIITPALRNFVTWQTGGSNPGSGPFGTGCPGATPTHNTTWGSVKSLYR